jgi:hypothetical protein
MCVRIFNFFVSVYDLITVDLVKSEIKFGLRFFYTIDEYVHSLGGN